MVLCAATAPAVDGAATLHNGKNRTRDVCPLRSLIPPVNALVMDALVWLRVLVHVLTGADAESPGRRERPRNLLGARANPCTAEDHPAGVGV